MLPAPIACRHTGSGLFHSPPGVLFTFPSRYCFTIGHLSCLALDHGRPEFNRNFTCSGLLRNLAQTGTMLSPTGLSPSAVGFPNTIQLALSLVTARRLCNILMQNPITPTYATLAGLHVFGLGYSPFAHHYSENLFDFFYIRLLRCFTSPTSPLFYTGLHPAVEGLPHSDTSGSRVACASPELFAAYRVLLR